MPTDMTIAGAFNPPMANSGVSRNEPSAPSDARTEDPLWRVAQSFEAAFLAEMLAHTGAAKGQDFGGGGYAEETFRSLLSREWAAGIAEQGGIGLARHIYESMATSAIAANAGVGGDV